MNVDNNVDNNADAAGLRQEVVALKERLEDLERRLSRRDVAPTESFDGLVCRVNDELLAWPLAHVIEVVAMAETTTLPEAPRHVLGVLDVGGISWPVIDVGARIAQRKPKVDPSQLIVLWSDRDQQRVGLVVDAIVDVTRLAPTKDDDVGLDVPHARYVMGTAHFGDSIVTLLSVTRLLSSIEAQGQAT